MASAYGHSARTIRQPSLADWTTLENSVSQDEEEEDEEEQATQKMRHLLKPKRSAWMRYLSKKGWAAIDIMRFMHAREKTVVDALNEQDPLIRGLDKTVEPPDPWFLEAMQGYERIVPYHHDEPKEKRKKRKKKDKKHKEVEDRIVEDVLFKRKKKKKKNKSPSIVPETPQTTPPPMRKRQLSPVFIRETQPAPPTSFSTHEHNGSHEESTDPDDDPPPRHIRKRAKRSVTLTSDDQDDDQPRGRRITRSSPIPNRRYSQCLRSTAKRSSRPISFVEWHGSDGDTEEEQQESGDDLEEDEDEGDGKEEYIETEDDSKEGESEEEKWGDDEDGEEDHDVDEADEEDTEDVITIPKQRTKKMKREIDNSGSNKKRPASDAKGDFKHVHTIHSSPRKRKIEDEDKPSTPKKHKPEAEHVVVSQTPQKRPKLMRHFTHIFCITDSDGSNSTEVGRMTIPLYEH
ncbi:hypothetical protein D9615_003485 [Tricholomella constricta]|uniref:Uncharacterized protein n=1 Tax=Tricholomella constricta TaxID=117010 RepID=A0A8H5HJC3_9AGAR|nr:hypothetical protein D9615_003485 [Tricholomella constricta]